VGSHLGAFLEAAKKWGWRPIGLDIGESTSAFARKRGGTVKSTALDALRPVIQPGFTKDSRSCASRSKRSGERAGSIGPSHTGHAISFTALRECNESARNFAGITGRFAALAVNGTWQLSNHCTRGIMRLRFHDCTAVRVPGSHTPGRSAKRPYMIFLFNQRTSENGSARETADLTSPE
jgi:hypothetical protein